MEFSYESLVSVGEDSLNNVTVQEMSLRLGMSNIHHRASPAIIALGHADEKPRLARILAPKRVVGHHELESDRIRSGIEVLDHELGKVPELTSVGPEKSFMAIWAHRTDGRVLRIVQSNP